MDKIERDIIITLGGPFFLVLNVMAVMLLNSWGRWLLFDDSINIPSYFTDKHDTAIQAINYALTSSNIAELISGFLLFLIYLLVTFMWIKALIISPK